MSVPVPKDEEQSPPPTQAMASIPELPLLTAEDILPLFVLPSATGAGDASVDGVTMVPFDFDKLTFLGNGVIHFAVTTHLFGQDKLSYAEVEYLRQEFTQPRTWAHWASLYDYFPALGHGLGTDDVDGAKIFSAYVGGLYHQDGIEPIKNWIPQLFAYNAAPTTVLNSPTTPSREQDTATGLSGGSSEPSSSAASSTKLQRASTGSELQTQTPTQSRKREREVPSAGEGRSSPSPKRSRISSSTSNSGEGHAVSASSSPSGHRIGHVPITTHAPSFIPIPAETPTANSSRGSTSTGAVTPYQGAQTSSQPQKRWMSVLNEACMVVRATRNWATESEGADHLKTWKATLTMPELDVIAVGEGKTKKVAQEEAARKACERLNWTQSYKW